jgi:phage tail-like protein
MTFVLPMAAQAVAGLVSPRDILGLNNRFHVEIGGEDLGSWGQCSNLAVAFENVKIKVGGVYDYETYLPERMTYPAITLKRAINPKDSMALQSWLAKKVEDWMYSANGAGSGDTAKITLYDATGADGGIMTWSLRNVYPSKWTGPQLDAMTSGIAMETLELVHEGFL